MQRKVVVAGIVGVVLAACPNPPVLHPVPGCPMPGLSTCADCPESLACRGDGGGQGGGAGGGATGGGLANLIFMTVGMYSPGSLGDGDGGVPIADALCNNVAKASSFPGHYVALLSTSKRDVKDRIPPHVRGWRTLTGENVLDVLGEPWIFQNLTPNPWGDTPVLTGSTDWGTFSGPSCDDWTTATDAGAYRAGNANRWFPGMLDSSLHRCDEPARLYCLQVDLDVPVPRTVSASERRVFVTSGMYRSGRGLAGFDDDCAREALDAGLSGSFVARLPLEATYASSRFDAMKGRYYRLDGVLVGGPNNSYLNQAPIQVTPDVRLLVPDGRPWPNSPLLLPTDVAVWEGAPCTGCPGSNSTCTDWLSQAGSSFVRDATTTMDISPRDCSQPAHLICVETR